VIDRRPRLETDGASLSGDNTEGSLMKVSSGAATPILIADHPGMSASVRSRRRTNLTRVCVLIPTGTFHVIATSARDSRVSATSIVTVVPAGFLAAANMLESRIGPTATLLSSGKVLIAGGECTIGWDDYEICPTGSAEVFDPVAGAFSRTGGMTAARSYHTATLLPNGKVLITGGGIASAELFDPATGIFAMTGSMSAVRSGHAATLLSNGRVLITGGFSVDSSLSTAEVYDPQTGTFSPAAGTHMTRPRTRHTATRLTNGYVLIAGGEGSDDSYTTAELFDPVTGTFTATGSMSYSRYASAATLLGNGTVLITGGSLPRSMILLSADSATPATWLRRADPILRTSCRTERF
jgi:hypothetical protein